MVTLEEFAAQNGYELTDPDLKQAYEDYAVSQQGEVQVGEKTKKALKKESKKSAKADKKQTQKELDDYYENALKPYFVHGGAYDHEKVGALLKEYTEKTKANSGFRLSEPAAIADFRRLHANEGDRNAFFETKRRSAVANPAVSIVDRVDNNWSGLEANRKAGQTTPDTIHPVDGDNSSQKVPSQKVSSQPVETGLEGDELPEELKASEEEIQQWNDMQNRLNNNVSDYYQDSMSGVWDEASKKDKGILAFDALATTLRNALQAKPGLYSAFGKDYEGSGFGTEKSMLEQGIRDSFGKGLERRNERLDSHLKQALKINNYPADVSMHIDQLMKEGKLNNRLKVDLVNVISNIPYDRLKAYAVFAHPQDAGAIAAMNGIQLVDWVVQKVGGPSLTGHPNGGN